MSEENTTQTISSGSGPSGDVPVISGEVLDFNAPMASVSGSPVDNALIRQEETAVEVKTEKAAPIYDAEAKNRFEFTAREGVEQYETAHVFKPLSDERYVKAIKAMRIRGNADDVTEESREALCSLWDDQIDVVENTQFPNESDFRKFIGSNEKLEGMRAFLAVAIAADIVEAKGPRILGDADRTQKVLTEAWVNNELAVQTHVLKASTFEWEKKYARIEQKQFKRETTRGLRRQPKIEYVPQDERYGELYDEMFVSQEGFANGVIPLRFKTLVVSHLFGEKLNQTPLGK